MLTFQFKQYIWSSLLTLVPLQPSRPGKPWKIDTFISFSILHIDQLPSGPYNKIKKHYCKWCSILMIYLLLDLEDQANRDDLNKRYQHTKKERSVEFIHTGHSWFTGSTLFIKKITNRIKNLLQHQLLTLSPFWPGRPGKPRSPFSPFIPSGPTN